jgi:hypothetical protein
VLAAELLSGATLPELAISPRSILPTALVVTGGYAGAAVILRRMGFEASLRKTLDIVLLLVVTIASAGMVACGFVATYAISGIVPWGGFPDAVFHF